MLLPVCKIVVVTRLVVGSDFSFELLEAQPPLPNTTTVSSIIVNRCFLMIWLPKRRLVVERVKGIEPSYAAWEAAVLPLNYTRGGTVGIVAWCALNCKRAAIARR